MAQLKPERLILLHSNDQAESNRPAIRLADYYREGKSPDFSPKETVVEQISSDSFKAIKHRLGELAGKYGISRESGVIHFTGGNKLMATAAYEWAKEEGWPACYLERGNVLNEFTFSAPGATAAIRPTRLDPHLVKDADPLRLLRAQLDEAKVVEGREGEVLTLNRAGLALSDGDLKRHLSGWLHHDRGGFDFQTLLNVGNPMARADMPGDNLERGAAVMALRCGVPVVRRSVELAASASGTVTQSEIDLIFNWKGRLWLVDCKAKSSSAGKLRALTDRMRKLGWNVTAVQAQLDKLKGDLSDTEARLLKEDLQQVSEIGGLLGSAIAVRMQGVSDSVAAYARTRRPKVEIVHAAEMPERFRALLG